MIYWLSLSNLLFENKTFLETLKPGGQMLIWILKNTNIDVIIVLVIVNVQIAGCRYRYKINM